MDKDTKMKKVKPETYPSMGEGKKIKIYPTFRLSDTDMPEIKDMEVGKKYNIEMEIEVMSKEQGSAYNQSDANKDIKATFKVMKVGCDMEDGEDGMEDDKAEKKMSKMSKMTGKEWEMEQARRTRGGTGSRFDK